MRFFASSSLEANDAISSVADGGPGSRRGLPGRCMLTGPGKLPSSGANDRHSGYERERTGPPVSPAKRSELANPVDEVNFLHGPEGEDSSFQSPVSRRPESKVQSEARPVQGLVEGWPAGMFSHSKIPWWRLTEF
ncbi:hypothetical protein CSIM01_09505 [Colletotrichum simmondsii]|uniref:Uncharacterized protein n=1 Tax=Colletotrichum simmondsii TaxID=703756 RepID=A0A135T9C2_9PEZI|nr:hypothetical protein CSIM01_09505 [Colletotrichum simmondsii]